MKVKTSISICELHRRLIDLSPDYPLVIAERLLLVEKGIRFENQQNLSFTDPLIQPIPIGRLEVWKDSDTMTTHYIQEIPDELCEVRE